MILYLKKTSSTSCQTANGYTGNLFSEPEIYSLAFSFEDDFAVMNGFDQDFKDTYIRMITVLTFHSCTVNFNRLLHHNVQP